MQPGTTYGLRHTLTSGEASAGTITVPTKGMQLTGAMVHRRAASGATIAALLDTVVVTPEAITITEVSPTWVAGETIDVIMF